MCCLEKKVSKTRGGLTLLEVVYAISLVSFLIGSVLFVYTVTLRSMSNLGRRTDLHEKLHFGLERVVRDAREAKAFAVTSNHDLRFTLSESGTDNSYLYYFYNTSDTWPPAFNQTSYDLKRASLTVSGGNLSAGTFTYGSGDLIMTGLRPPSSESSITSSGNYAIVKLTAKTGDDSLTLRGYVKPRNL